MPLIASIAAGASKVLGFTGFADVVRDLYFKFITILIKADPGLTSDPSPMIPPSFNSDYSSNNTAMTLVGAARPTRFSPYLGNYYSTYFNGSSSVDYALGTTGAAAFGTGDFTIEFWVYPTAAPATNWTPFLTIGFSGGGQEIRISQNINATGWGWLYPPNSGVTDVYAGFGTLTLFKWYHIAMVRSGSNMYLFLNGVLTSTGTGVSFNFTNTTLFRVGGSQAAYTDGNCNAYIHNLRITKGTGLYTTSFTPPTSPLVGVAGTTVLAHSNVRLIDTASGLTPTINSLPVISNFVPYTPTTYSYGSAYLNGSTDYLTPTVVANATGFGTNNFTIECWIYYTASAATQYVLDARTAGLWALGFGLGTSGQFQWYTGAAALFSYTGMLINNWYHIAVVRSGTSTLTLFVNGVAVQTATDATNYTSTSGVLYIGQRYISAAGSLWTGYIADLRIVNGSAIYTTAFSVPTTPLTAVSGTQLLSLQYNGSLVNSLIVDNSTNNNSIITRNGTTAQGTFSPYGGNWSTYFNGTTDNLTISQTISLPTATTPFTMEAWVYFTALSSVAIASNAFSTGAIPFVMGMGTGSTTIGGSTPWFGYYNGSAWTTAVQSATALNTYTWYHLAYVYTGTTATIYANGVSIGSASATTWATTAGTSGFYLGRRWDSGGQNFHSGYISNFRLTIGSALYTSTFSPPTASLTATTNTTLLMATDGTFRETSFNNYAVTVAGTPKTTHFGPLSSNMPIANSGYYSAKFNGSTDYYSITTSSLALGAGNWTVETWIYPTSVAIAQNIMFDWRTSNNTQPVLYMINAVVTWRVNSATLLSGGTIVANVWTHLALVKNGTTTTLYVNGASAASVTDTVTYASDATFQIGKAWDANYWNGYLSNLRIVIGTAVYTSAFTPSTTPLTVLPNTKLLTMLNSAVNDSSPANLLLAPSNGTMYVVEFSPFGSTRTFTSGTAITPKVVGGSTFHDGTGSYLVAASNTLFTLGTGDFTIDFWFYTTVNANNIFDMRTGSDTSVSPVIYTSAGVLYYWVAANRITGSSPALNCWNHIAVSRRSGTTKMFLNGVLQGTAYADTNSYVVSPVTIGGRYNNVTPWYTGYLSDVRIISGVGLYYGNFALPTAPSTATTGSVLLLNNNTPAVYTSSGMVNIQMFGNATVTTSASQYGTGSMSFDGTNSYAILQMRPELDILTGDFTIECWVYPKASTAVQFIIGQWQQTAGLGGFDLSINGTKFGFGFGAISEAADVITSSLSITLNTWYHVAVVRSGSVFTMYVNGNSTSGGTTTSANTRAPLTVNLTMGNYYNSSATIGATGANYLNGYVDDLRITKGYARYTGNFIPPATFTEYSTL